MEKIEFWDDEMGESILFEVVDQLTLQDQKYILVVDEEEVATILKEIKEDDESLTYVLVENDDEFQKVTLLFMENDAYDVEI